MFGKIATSDSPLANITSGIEERRCNLIGRHRQLRDKVTTIERSIPALLAYSMWMTDGQDCHDAPYRKVRELVNRLAPRADPADRLLAELRNAVNELHRETAQLHDKIIDADVKLEETTMELESLELANKEMEEKLVGLQNEVRTYGTPSLHSIRSEDLVCLKKIHQLAEEELKLKSCIDELKGKENTYRRQMNQLLSCKKFQRDNIKLMEGAQKTCCLCPTSAYDKTKKSLRVCEELRPPRSSRIPLDDGATRVIKSHKPRSCKISCKSCKPTSAATFGYESPRSASPFCKFPLNNASKSDLSRSLKYSSVPCDPGKTCDECEVPATCKQISSCRCTCEGKCTPELSSALCDCRIVSLASTDKTIYQSTIPSALRSDSGEDDSISDDEFCECCSCGCEASEISS